MSGLAVLVTGGAGYIGAEVTRALLDEGHRPTVLDNLSTGRREAVPAGVPFVAGDVGDGQLVGRLLADLRPQAIMHFAGSTSAPDSVRNPLDFYENNTCKSRTLIAAAVGCASRPVFVFSSSAAVYGAPDRARVDEDTPARPINPYGASKLMTEQMLADAAAAHGLASVALRYFNVIGCGRGALGAARAAAPGSLLSVALDVLAGERPEAPIYGCDHPTRDGTGVRDFIHVSDVASAHLAVLPLLLRGQGPPVLNCGYGRGWSVLEMLDAVERVSGRHLVRRQSPRRPGDPSEVVADNRRILQSTDWRPRHDDLDRTVRQAIELRLRRNAPSSERPEPELAGQDCSIG